MEAQNGGAVVVESGGLSQGKGHSVEKGRSMDGIYTDKGKRSPKKQGQR